MIEEHEMKGSVHKRVMYFHTGLLLFLPGWTGR